MSLYDEHGECLRCSLLAVGGFGPVLLRRATCVPLGFSSTATSSGALACALRRRDGLMQRNDGLFAHLRPRFGARRWRAPQPRCARRAEALHTGCAPRWRRLLLGGARLALDVARPSTQDLMFRSESPRAAATRSRASSARRPTRPASPASRQEDHRTLAQEIGSRRCPRVSTFIKHCSSAHCRREGLRQVPARAAHGGHRDRRQLFERHPQGVEREGATATRAAGAVESGCAGWIDLRGAPGLYATCAPWNSSATWTAQRRGRRDLQRLRRAASARTIWSRRGLLRAPAAAPCCAPCSAGGSSDVHG